MEARLRVAGIAFCGPIGSGKTTMAHALRTLYPETAKCASFADALRNEAAIALRAITPGDTHEEFIDAFKDPNTKSRYRPFLQWLGTEYRRTEDPHYWVRQLAYTINSQSRFTWLVDDCRFMNEYEELRLRGFVFVRLANRPVYDEVIPETPHASERDWSQFTFDFGLDWEPIARRTAACLRKLDTLLQ